MESNNFRQQLRRNLIEYTLLRWESALLIAFTIISSGASYLFQQSANLPSWAWMGWLAFGCIAEITLIYSSLTDPESMRRVMESLLSEDYDRVRIKDSRLRAKLDKAFDYHRRIEDAILNRKQSLLRHSLHDTLAQANEWQRNIYHLTQRLDRYQGEKERLETDRVEVSRRLGELRQQQQYEKDTALKRQLDDTVASMQYQLETIQRLENTMEQAELKLDHTLSALGTVYSQTMLVEAKKLDSNHADQLRSNIDNEVKDLDDLLEAMDKVYDE